MIHRLTGQNSSHAEGPASAGLFILFEEASHTEALKSELLETGHFCQVKAQGPLNVALIGVPEVTASTLYGMFDLFSSTSEQNQRSSLLSIIFSQALTHLSNKLELFAIQEAARLNSQRRGNMFSQKNPPTTGTEYSP